MIGELEPILYREDSFCNNTISGLFLLVTVILIDVPTNLPHGASWVRNLIVNDKLDITTISMRYFVTGVEPLYHPRTMIPLMINLTFTKKTKNKKY